MNDVLEMIWKKAVGPNRGTIRNLPYRLRKTTKTSDYPLSQRVFEPSITRF